MKPAIRVENLSKRYRIGTRTHPANRNLTEAITDGVRRLFRGSKQSNGEGDGTFWALKDVSFEVQPGEVVGIIGRNGAGKSTLLKILSRIVEPTSGWAEVRGRMASLLEVGTGFHPELTGRENVYMNGSILGMSKREIDRKFDEIVAFAEIEQFIDTPVKRYSSGMYVRLAFAVAAHLDAEILVVDEVLAVGDVSFQQKCLGKMKAVTTTGRTVLFVSHNYDAILRLCSSTLLISNGHLIGQWPTDQAISTYYTINAPSNNDGDQLRSYRSITCDLSPIIRKVSFTSSTIKTTQATWCFLAGGDAQFEIELHNLNNKKDVVCSIAILDQTGTRVALFNTLYHSGLLVKGAPQLKLICHIPCLPLTPGRYSLEISVGLGDAQILERVDRAACIEALFSDYFGTGRIPSYKQGHILLHAHWTTNRIGSHEYV